MIEDTILASIPPAFRAEYEADIVHRVGMLLFRRGQPGIVAHLVETGAMAPAVNGLASLNPIGAGVQLAGQVVGQAIQVKQNSAIAAGIDTLKTMGLSNLALSGVGIGTTLISHALVSERLERIRQNVESIQETLDRVSRKIESLELKAIERDFIALDTACEVAEEAWLANDSTSEWKRAADKLHDLQKVFFVRAEDLLAARRYEEMEPFIDACALAGTTRVACRIATNDFALAIKNAEQLGAQLAGLIEPVGTPEWIEEKARQSALRVGTPEYVLAFTGLKADADARRSAYLERSQIALSAPHTLSRIKSLGLDGREWLERVRSEDSEPVLLLSGNDAET
ncbi:hypothetical protein K3163_02390 [Qipengyuania sp. 1NDW9]|uniref:hypothetical protein n=1 Tax=Qipengyuania xiapuensis TaxID=2867236 RepID=UPI001C86BFA3|nr:hypothetical protein [Qipengyuania xiapuensis]MBX7492054.1 hypothetical protein [Qipengyuania xiapuensis]